MPKRHPTSLRYVLDPDPEALASIQATMGAYARMMRILDGIDVAMGGRANLVQIHDQAYLKVRDETGLPSRLVTLGMRDHSLRVPGEEVTSLPLDEKIFAVKGPDTVSLKTVSGRHLVPYRVEGYSEGWTDFAPARLHVESGRCEIRIGVDVKANSQEGDMIQEGILGRMGRVIAGAANAAVDGLEARNPAAVVEQAIREIDKAIDEAKADLGKDKAEAHRIDASIAAAEKEISDLGPRIRFALSEKRDDLAKAAVARQIDFEAQLDALRRAARDVNERMDEAARGLAAVRAARREAEVRLADLRRSEAASQPKGARRPLRENIEASMRAVARATSVPGGPRTGAAEMDELERLHRDSQIEERLARIRGEGR